MAKRLSSKEQMPMEAIGLETNNVCLSNSSNTSLNAAHTSPLCTAIYYGLYTHQLLLQKPSTSETNALSSSNRFANPSLAPRKVQGVSEQINLAPNPIRSTTATKMKALVVLEVCFGTHSLWITQEFNGSLQRYRLRTCGLSLATDGTHFPCPLPQSSSVYCCRC